MTDTFVIPAHVVKTKFSRTFTEPTRAYSAARSVVLDGFREFNAPGQTIVMATHEVKSACAHPLPIERNSGRADFVC